MATPIDRPAPPNTLPAIAAGTLLARHLPPPVPALMIRLAALGLLLLSGAALVLTAARALLR